MVAKTNALFFGCSLVALTLAFACGGSSDDKKEEGKAGSAGAPAAGGSAGKGGTGGSGGTGGTAQGGTKSGTGGTATQGGSGGKGGSSGSGGSTPKGGTGGTAMGGTGGSITISDMCGDFTPCGGDIVGKWKIEGVCGQAVESAMGDMPTCAEETVTTATTGSAVYTFNADGTASITGDLTVTADITIPDSCVEASASGLPPELFCTLLGATGGTGLGAGGAGGDAPLNLTCTYATGACSCHLEEPAATDMSGTYTVSGNQITITNADGTQTGDYCVDGGTLSIRSVNDAGDTSTVTASKQ